MYSDSEEDPESQAKRSSQYLRHGIEATPGPGCGQGLLFLVHRLGHVLCLSEVV